MNKWAIAAAALTMGLAGPLHAGDRHHWKHADGIEGVWLLDVTLRNCASGAPLFEPFPTINTYHEGGTMSEHGSRMPPAARNSGQGVWKQVARHRFTSRFLFQRFDPNGFYLGTQEVTRKMELSNDGETLEIDAKVKIVDASGAVLSQGCATEVGRRF
jgi:hypothetical protein